MDVYMDIRSMIGNTPILRLQNFETKKGVRLYAKLELANPAGSVKDRVGMYMIDDAKRRGLL
ncbi:MAG: pyridoxal-phosphate dependent enzyme, partial [Lachnospiraceae bacterium]|nr:pyridoxal-phosphate dependent enzyme [Lachnospiraceae bacterium]